MLVMASVGADAQGVVMSGPLLLAGLIAVAAGALILLAVLSPVGSRVSLLRCRIGRP